MRLREASARQASGLDSPHVPPFSDLSADAEGRARRRGGYFAQADGAGGVDPADGGGVVDLPARGVAGGAEGRAGDPRGDGGDRLPGDADAGDAAGGGLGEDGPVWDRRAVQARGP